MSIKDLPVRPSMIGDKVREKYVEELQAVDSVEKLREFTLRWRPLFNLKHRGMPKGVEEDMRHTVEKSFKSFESLKTGDFDHGVAFGCIRKIYTNDVCPHMREYNCEGANLVLPMTLLDAQAVAEHYGVSTDLALIQLNGGLEALEGP